VQAALAHGLDEPGQQGKHAAFDPDHEEKILDWIRQNAKQNIPVTQTEIMDHCTAEFKIKFTRELGYPPSSENVQSGVWRRPVPRFVRFACEWILHWK
jgi:hypothetical protein